MDLDEVLDVPCNGAGAAAEGFAGFAFVLGEFLGEIPRVGVIVLLGFRYELEFPQKLFAFLVHDKGFLSRYDKTLFVRNIVRIGRKYNTEERKSSNKNCGTTSFDIGGSV